MTFSSWHGQQGVESEWWKNCQICISNWATINETVVPQGGNMQQGCEPSCPPWLLFRVGWGQGQRARLLQQEENLQIFTLFIGVNMPETTSSYWSQTDDNEHRVVPEHSQLQDACTQACSQAHTRTLQMQAVILCTSALYPRYVNLYKKHGSVKDVFLFVKERLTNDTILFPLNFVSTIKEYKDSSDASLSFWPGVCKVISCGEKIMTAYLILNQFMPPQRGNSTV